MNQPVEQQRYRVIERLAAGGMAEVFLAESAGIEGFKKQVAIKRVLPHLSEKKSFIAMFLDEARLSAHMSHSNVVQVFDIGVGDNTYFIVMEYVDGADLKAVIQYIRSRGTHFPIEAAVHVCIKICEALAYAHERTNAEGEPLNAVHRDVSPPNVLISKHGEVKLVDFGLAKASTQLEKSEAGIIKGKFHYLSPEAAHGKEVDPRSDIFAVGIILWELLAGRRLFDGKSDYQTVKLVQRAEVPLISELHPDATPELESIVSRALARDPEQRYRSARALAQDLSRFLFRLGRPVSAFDIAELVRAAMLFRNKKGDLGGSAMIDKLIQETLFQFRSLRDGEQGGGGPGPETPFSFGGFEDLSGMVASEQSSLLVRNALPEDAFEEGNLAALEGPEERVEPGDEDSAPPTSSPPPAGVDVAHARVVDLMRTAAEGSDPALDRGVPAVAAAVENACDSRRPPSEPHVASPDGNRPTAVASSASKVGTAVKVGLAFLVLAGLAAAVAWFRSHG